MNLKKTRWLFALLLFFGGCSTQEKKCVVLTEKEFKQVISDGYTLVDFHAPWCPACITLKPIVEEIGREDHNLRVLMMDIDDHQDLRRSYGVKTVPSLLLFHDGELVTMINKRSKEEILESAKMYMAQKRVHKMQMSPARSVTLSEFSETLGSYLSKEIEALGIDVDEPALIHGLKEKQAKISPDEFHTMLTYLQESTKEARALENLHLANDVLFEASRKMDVQTISRGKLYYSIDRPGEGIAVKAHSTPTIKIDARLSQSQSIGNPNEAFALPLDATLEGLKLGIKGMREGEKRTLYIHPDLAFSMDERFPPNALLVCTVEVLSIKSRDDIAQSVNHSRGELFPLKNNAIFIR